MPNWSHEVPDDPRGYALPLLRTPAARPLNAVITSDNLIGCDTHFWGGHTLPCTQTDCEACAAGVSYRWHGYVGAYNTADQLHFIFEMTAQAAKVLEEYRTDHRTLRACQFEAYRWKQRKNGRVIIRCQPSAIHPALLPHPPDLARVMAIIWRLPVPNVNPGGLRSGRPHIAVDPNGDGRSSDPRDYATPQP